MKVHIPFSLPDTDEKLGRTVAFTPVDHAEAHDLSR